MNTEQAEFIQADAERIELLAERNSLAERHREELAPIGMRLRDLDELIERLLCNADQWEESDPKSFPSCR